MNTLVFCRRCHHEFEVEDPFTNKEVECPNPRCDNQARIHQARIHETPVGEDGVRSVFWLPITPNEPAQKAL